MAKFRKKPVVIDAVQWNVNGAMLGRECDDHPAVRGTSYAEVNQMIGTSGCSNDTTMWDWSRMGCIETLEGKHLVTPGDWVITGVKGEVYPCKPDIFEATYDPAFGNDSRENYALSQPRLLDLKEDLATHGKTCNCAHKKMCEDREEWLIAEIARRVKGRD